MTRWRRRSQSILLGLMQTDHGKGSGLRVLDQNACWTSSVLVVVLCCLGCGISLKERDGALSGTRDFLERVTEKGPVKLVVRVSPPEPRLSDLVQLDVQVTSPPGIEVRPPAFGQAVGDFLVRDYSEKKTSASSVENKDVSQRRFVYQLEPVQAGRHLIRSFGVEFIDRRPNSESRDQTSLIESDPLEVSVTSELGDQLPSLSDLEPMLPPRPLRFPQYWLWGALACIGLAIGLLIFWRRRRMQVSFAPPPSQTPEEIAHAALAALLAEQLPARGLVKEFYLRLTGIVRQFIEGTTGLRAPEFTTEEFLRAMRTRDVFPAERSVRLQEFLEVADMVKYAGQQPSADQIELSITRAHEFVDLNRPQTVAFTSGEESRTGEGD